MAKAKTTVAASAVTLNLGAQTISLSEIPDADRAKVALQVTAAPEKGFWRAGRFFGREPVQIALSDLSDAEIEAIVGEKMLSTSFVPLVPQTAEAPAT